MQLDVISMAVSPMSYQALTKLVHQLCRRLRRARSACQTRRAAVRRMLAARASRGCRCYRSADTRRKIRERGSAHARRCRCEVE